MSSDCEEGEIYYINVSRLSDYTCVAVTGVSFQNEPVGENGISDIQQLIVQHQTISLPNAITLNEALIDQLKVLLFRLEESLAKCQLKYESNDQLLSALTYESATNVRNNEHKDFYEEVRKPDQFAGAPYFKTRRGKEAPPNEEGLYRRSQGTLYPMDFRLDSRIHWTLSDKMLLLRSIKEAIVRFLLKVEQKTTTCIDKNTSLAVLVDRVASQPSFQLNWQRMSDLLFGRHSPFGCQTMWNLNLHPRLRRGKWTDEEDDKLLEAARSFNFQNWQEIANAVGTERSMFQCFLRYQTKFQSVERTGDKFSLDEDRRLAQLVNEHRVGNIIPWTKIAQFFNNRSKQTLYYRYVFSLRPNISRERFSVEEDCIFLAAVQEYGLNFQKIATEFPNRTLVQLRAHYNNVLKRNSTLTPWTVEEDKELMRLQGEGKTWAQISEIIQTQTRQRCRSRHEVLAKHLARKKKNTIENAPRRNRCSRNGVTTSNWANKISEIGKNIRETTDKQSQTSVLKLASLIKLLDVEISEEVLEKFAEEFTEDEMGMLRAVLKQDEDKLMDIPMHRPTLMAFQNLRKTLLERQDRAVANDSTTTDGTVERDNFKKQFKALFYLPAILANIKDDSRSSVVESEYGPIVVSY